MKRPWRLALAALLAAAAGCATRPSPQAPPSAWTQQAADDLEGYLTAVRGWETAPDPEGLSQSCLSDPRITDGWKPAQEGTPPAVVDNPTGLAVSVKISRVVQDVLCRRDQGLCDALDPLAIQEADELAKDPNTPPGPRSLHNAHWCRTLTTELFYLQSIVQGKPDPAGCASLLALEFPSPLTAEESSRLCPLMEQDIRTPGSDALCREISSRPYGGKLTPYAECSGSGLWFAKGEEYCAEKFGANENLYICQVKARVMKATRSGDPAGCRGDKYCEALAGAPGVCGGAAEPDEGLSSRALCEAWSFHRVQSWIFDVDARARPVLDRLLSYRDRLARTDADEARRFSGRLDKATAVSEAALETMEGLRRRMNRGELPGQR